MLRSSFLKFFFTVGTIGDALLIHMGFAVWLYGIVDTFPPHTSSELCQDMPDYDPWISCGSFCVKFEKWSKVLEDTLGFDDFWIELIAVT